MKTQRRHELQTNELADRIGHYLQQAKPYSRHIGLGLLAAVLIVGASLYLINQQAVAHGVSWSEFLRAFHSFDPKALAEVGKIHEGTAAALWARQSAGDFDLAEGARLLYRDRKEAARLLEEAETSYLYVEKQGAKYPLLVDRARFGLAQVYESMSRVDKAREYYEKVSQTAKDSVLGTAARQRAERLNDKAVERWYAWFERQEPPPPPSTTPGAKATEPKVPADLDTLPDKPDLPTAPAEPAAKPAVPSETAKPMTKEPAKAAPAGKEPAAKAAAPSEAAKTVAKEPAKAAPAEKEPAAKPSAAK